MRKTPLFTGCGCVLVTPFGSDGAVDYAAMAKHIDWQLKYSDAIIVAGTTGEASTLTDEEHVDVIRFVVERVGGKLPVVAGTGSNDTVYAAELSAEAEEAGADGLLVVTPYYNKTSQAGLIRHFSTIADAVHIPIVLYNIPSRTNINISIPTFKALAEHENILAVKESGGNIGYFASILDETDLVVYSGDDGMTVPVMALGGSGVFSVAANIIPEEMQKMCNLCLENDFASAGKEQLRLNKLIAALFSDVNPIPVKAAMNLMGLEAGMCRLPLVEMADDTHEKLRQTLVDYNLLK
jgi:4-hydroxy-tetrahydrodipicolinate synthase